MIMNPDDAAGRKRGSGFGIITRGNSSSGFTIGNIGQPDITLKEKDKETLHSTGSKRFLTKYDGTSNFVEPSPSFSNFNLHSSSIHSDVMDESVKRDNLPSQNAIPKFKIYRKKGLTFPFNDAPREVHFLQAKQNDINASKKSLNIRTFTLFHGHKNNRKLAKKDTTGTKKSMIGLQVKHDDSHKRSGIKEMTIHNQLGGMRIKSNPEEGTTVSSESGNIDITMVNNKASSNKAAKKQTAGSLKKTKDISIRGSARHSITELKSDINDYKSKNRLHIVDYEYTGMRKSEVIPKYMKYK